MALQFPRILPQLFCRPSLSDVMPSKTPRPDAASSPQGRGTALGMEASQGISQGEKAHFEGRRQERTPPLANALGGFDWRWILEPKSAAAGVWSSRILNYRFHNAGQRFQNRRLPGKIAPLADALGSGFAWAERQERPPRGRVLELLITDSTSAGQCFPEWGCVDVVPR